MSEPPLETSQKWEVLAFGEVDAAMTGGAVQLENVPRMGSSPFGFQSPENVDGGFGWRGPCPASSSKDDSDFHSRPSLPNAVCVCVRTVLSASESAQWRHVLGLVSMLFALGGLYPAIEWESDWKQDGGGS